MDEKIPWIRSKLSVFKWPTTDFDARSHIFRVRANPDTVKLSERNVKTMKLQIYRFADNLKSVE